MPAPRVLAVALVLALSVGCGTGAAGGPAPTVTRLEITYAGGAVVGGVSRYPVPRGSTVTLLVHSDVADEVHLHGYDRKVDVPAGGTAELTFTADLPGTFEVELESRGAPLARLLVS
jgi:hypothetical protein